MRTIISLNGNRWHCAASSMSTPDVSEIQKLPDAFPASVPGDVHLDVLAASRPGADVYEDLSRQSVSWVEDRDWWYWTDFTLALAPGQRAWLVLHGADYISWTFLNGHLLGQHEGMFSEQEYEITDHLQNDNRLAVRFLAPTRFPDHHISLYNKWLNRYEQLVGADVGCDPERRSTLKCQMTYGWDFAPGLRTIGLWDDVELLVTGPTRILAANVRAKLIEPGSPRSKASLDVELEADCQGSAPTELSIALREANAQAQADQPVLTRHITLRDQTGRQKLSVAAEIDNPRLWFPWDHGPQNLYELEIIASQGEQSVDRFTQTVGIRAVDSAGPVGQAFSGDGLLTLNGEPIYLRGASWVPVDAIPGRVSEQDYRELLQRVKDANLNCLRVWGGGLREKHAFYDLCDRMGILVWQEFPLACAFYTHYPVSPDYLALLGSECRAIVRTLRHHPAVFLWCGGNEFDSKANFRVVETIRQVVSAEDGSRLFLDVSPSLGESHNWNVWHQFFPPEAYREDKARLLSEFGLQSPPSAASLKRFIPSEALWPLSPAWTKHKGQLAKLTHYAAPFRAADTLDDFVRASQMAQAYGLKIGIEHARRHKPATAGFLVWQLNSPWPSIDWAIIDYYRTPKLAYETIKASASPVLIALEYELKGYQSGDKFRASVWIVNDKNEAMVDCGAEVRLGDAKLFGAQVDPAPNSAQAIGDFTVDLPDGPLTVDCRLTQPGRVLSENKYALQEFDGRWNLQARLKKLELRLRGSPAV